MSIPVSTARLSVILLAHDDPSDLLDSLAAQTLSHDRFEVLVVTDASGGAGARAWADVHPTVPVTLVDAAPGPGGSYNAGLDAATGTHVTFVDGRDRIGPRMLERLLESARSDAVTLTATASLEGPDGLIRFDTAGVVALMPFVGRPTTRTDLLVALGNLGGKAIPLALARAVRFREDITDRPELVFWAEVLATGAGLRLASLSADSAYLQRPRNPTTEIRATIETIGALQALALDDGAALKARTIAVERLIADDVRPYLAAHPGELRSVRAQLRAAGVADKRAPLERHAAEELVFLGAAPARDCTGSLLASRLAGHAIDVAVYQPDGAEHSLQTVRDPAADVIDELITSYGALQPSWSEVGDLLGRLQSEVEHQEAAKPQPYRRLRSLGAAPIEHLSAATTKLARPHLRWTAEFPLAEATSVVAGAETTVEGDAWFQVLGAGLVEAGYGVEDVPEQLPLFTEMITLGLADRIVFDTRDQAEQVLTRCPVPAIAERARAVTTVLSEPAEMIKLVVWDLDDTFWRGTLAEDGEVWILEENIHALKELASRGIVSSICSKNDHDAAREVLEKHGLWDQFVFPRIAFAPKGQAVKQLIADMGLRAANVLFVDDNATNLGEVAFYNPGIRVLDAAQLPELLDLPGTEGKPDPGHQRLAHYRLLEERHRAQAVAISNEDFLRSSGLRIELSPVRPADAERIHDMVMRTNQLNFTKKRISLAEVEQLLGDPAGRSATVRVSDNFGDYGIVGWYYLRNGELEHFLFSCRTINLGIEQHVYAHLGHPQITVIGETAGTIGPDDQLRDYITLEEVSADAAQSAGPASNAVVPDEDRLRIFALSACDLFQAVGRLALPMVDLWFECNTFRGPQRGVNTGTEYIRSCFEMSDESKRFAREHFLNYQGSTVFATEIFERPYDYVVLGIHDDLTYGQHRHRTRPDLVVQTDMSLRLALRSRPTPVTFGRLIDGHDTPGELEPGSTWLDAEFDDEGLITPQRLQENLAWILERLHPGTQLLVTTAPELPFYRTGAEDLTLLRDRAVVLNQAVRDFCSAQPRAHVVEMNNVIFDRGHVTDYVMHLTAERGHALAQSILDTMAAHPSDRLDRRALLGIGERPLALWDINPERAGAVAKALTSAGLAPGQIIDTQHPFDPSLAPFVLVVSDKRDHRIESELTRHGYCGGSDYLVLHPWVFSPDWQEAGA